MTREQKQRQMVRWLVRRERHGWSWAELSRRSGEPPWKLRWWQRRLAQRPTPEPRQSFAPVRVVSPAVSPCAPLEIVLPSGVRVNVPADFDPDPASAPLRLDRKSVV